MEAPSMLQSIEPQKQLHFSPYSDPEIETSKPYRMPPELPYIKSPGMNRKDIKYLESAEDKENAIVVDYNGPLEENMVPKLDENNLYIDESLGIAPLSTVNETCYTEAFNTHLTSSTPMTNHFKPSYRMKDDLQFASQNTVAQPYVSSFCLLFLFFFLFFFKYVEDTFTTWTLSLTELQRYLLRKLMTNWV